jgi:hypothetical protein
MFHFRLFKLIRLCMNLRLPMACERHFNQSRRRKKWKTRSIPLKHNAQSWKSRSTNLRRRLTRSSWMIASNRKSIRTHTRITWKCRRRPIKFSKTNYRSFFKAPHKQPKSDCITSVIYINYQRVCD